MVSRAARGIFLVILGIAMILALSACGGGGGNGVPSGDDIIDPDVQPPADVLFSGRLDLTPEVEVRFVDHNLRNERLSDNPLSEDPIIGIIHQATQTIEVAVMRINRWDFVEALLEQSQVVKVRIVTEKYYYDNPVYKPFYDKLEDPTLNHNNIEVRTDNEGAPRMMHSRFMIIDSARTVVGSYDWSGAGAEDTIGDFLILKDARITAAFLNQFEQMFAEGLFGINKRDETQHIWQIGGGHGRVEVYFGPKDDLRSRIQGEIEFSSSIGFVIKEFADVDLANFILNWAVGSNPFNGLGHELVAVINDIGVDTTDEEKAIYSAMLQLIAGDPDDAGSSPMQNSSINIANPFPVTATNHKYLISDRAELSAGDDSPSVLTGSANWTTSGFDLNDESMIILVGDPLVSKYVGYVEAFEPSLNDLQFEIRPEDFGEFAPNVLAYPNLASPDGLIDSHEVPYSIVYGVISNFEREVLLGLGDGSEQPETILIDVIFQIDGKTYLEGSEFFGMMIDNFDPIETTNPLKGYVLMVPAGELTITTIVTDSGGEPIAGAQNPSYQLEVGPGGVRRLDVTVAFPAIPTDGTGGGGGGGGGV